MVILNYYVTKLLEANVDIGPIFVCRKHFCYKIMNNFRNIGMLTVEQEPGKEIKEIKSSLDAAGESYEVLSSQELKKRYPELSFPSHYTGLLEHSAGILRADKCLKVLQVKCDFHVA